MIGRCELLDSYTHCFFDDKEDDDEFFFPAQMPNEDMWKKFELLPTPPLSPLRESNVENNILDSEISSMYLELCDFNDKEHPPGKTPFPESPPNLTSCQDPMWSGHIFDGEIPRFTETQKNFEAKPLMRTLTPSVDICPSDSACIDPQSVLAYPLDTPHEATYRNMGTETPSDSEEEIDVVSIAKHKMRCANLQSKKNLPSFIASALSDVHTTHNYSKQIIHVSYTAHKNSHKKTMKLIVPSNSLLKRNKSTDTCESSPVKRVKRHSLQLEAVVDSLDTDDSRTCVSRSRRCNLSVDSYDLPMQGPHKRNQHNVLERKRRNDLKSNFYSLRDAIPDLCKLDRAPKVLILQKAQAHIEELVSIQDRLVQELEKHTTTQQRLQQRLQELTDGDISVD